MCPECLGGKQVDPLSEAERLGAERIKVQDQQDRQSDNWLSKDEVRELLRECVVAVRPGEILVIGVSTFFSPRQLRELQESAQATLENWGSGIKVMVLPAAALAIIEAKEEVTS
jgi:hypothetical protein